MEQTLGKRITENRKRLGMTQDKLAEQLGITAQAVSKWENDQSCPDITMLPKLADIFGISTDALLGVAPAEAVHEAEVLTEDDRSGIHLHTDDNRWEMKWDAGRKSSLGFALWVLVTGGLLLASNMLDWNAGLWDIAWTTALTMFGLWGLFPRFSFFRLGCALFGGYFLLEKLHISLGFLQFEKALLLPACILLLGASLLADALKKNKRPRFTVKHNGKNVYSGPHSAKTRSECTQEGEHFCCTNAFGEEVHHVTLPQLASGDISTSFGQLTVDLSGCGEIISGAHIDASTAFGQLDIRVPKSCRAEITSSTAFGNVDIAGTPNADAATVLYLDCNASFGQIEVRYV